MSTLVTDPIVLDSTMQTQNTLLTDIKTAIEALSVESSTADALSYKNQAAASAAAAATSEANAQTYMNNAFSGTPDGYSSLVSTVNSLNSAFVESAIPNGSDLNNYTARGVYYAQTNADAASLSNCPTVASFVMLVFTRGTNSRPIQVIFAGFGDFIYMRGSTTSGFSASWRKFESTAVS